MKIIVTSDTFGVLPVLDRECDLFIHCGNFCPPIQLYEPLEKHIEWLDKEFAPWIKNIPAKHKIVMPGNLDLAVEFLDPNFEFYIDAIFLKAHAVTIDKMIVYGTPWTPYTEKRLNEELRLYVARNDAIFDAMLERIPPKTNILISRVAPLGILDKRGGESAGNQKMLDKVQSLPELKMNLFGFASDEGGLYSIKNNILYANANVGQLGYIGIEA